MFARNRNMAPIDIKKQEQGTCKYEHSGHPELSAPKLRASWSLTAVQTAFLAYTKSYLVYTAHYTGKSNMQLRAPGSACHGALSLGVSTVLRDRNRRPINVNTW